MFSVKVLFLHRSATKCSSPQIVNCEGKGKAAAVGDDDDATVEKDAGAASVGEEELDATPGTVVRDSALRAARRRKKLILTWCAD